MRRVAPLLPLLLALLGRSEVHRRRRSWASMVAILAAAMILGVATGCGGSTSTVTQMSQSIPTAAVPTAAQLKEKAAEEAAHARKEVRAKRADEAKERHDKAHKAAEQHATAAREKHEHEAEHQQKTEHEYPAAVQHNVILGCTASGGSTSQCRCYLKMAEAHLTVAQLAAIERGMGEGVAAPPEIAKWVKECKSK